MATRDDLIAWAIEKRGQAQLMRDWAWERERGRRITLPNVDQSVNDRLCELPPDFYIEIAVRLTRLDGLLEQAVKELNNDITDSLAQALEKPCETRPLTPDGVEQLVFERIVSSWERRRIRQAAGISSGKSLGNL